MAKLERDEKALRDSVEAGEWRSVRGRDEQAAHHQARARETLRKDRRINIRLAARDLEAIQQRALIEGVPYETLIASILHKYAAGRLVDKDVQS